ncbi:MAG: hypothetical protein K2M00_08015 [Muribaculaceae bacterium]|nr:hypothetical protein [Muribaculaceae bacterium]
MRKAFSLLLLATTIVASYANDYITLADSVDKSPVVGASVISSNGLIIGITDENGQISVQKSDYPLSLRCLGYEASTVDQSDVDSILMLPATYSLSEIVVSPADRPITRVVTYAREYCTGATTTDTLQLYCDYMLEYFFADGKVKGYSKSHQLPNSLNYRRYGRIANADGLDSIMRPKSDDDVSTLSFLQNMAFVPYDQKELTDTLKAGATSDTIQGKYFPKFIYRLNNGFFTIDCDALSDYKNHSFSPWFFKILGLTMDMQEAYWTLIYKQNESGKYGINDFISGTYNMHILGKGKLLKKMLGVQDAIHMNCYIEQYPVEIEHLTVEEYKELKKTYYERTEKFRVPANLQPLAPAIQSLIDRVNLELPINK